MQPLPFVSLLQYSVFGTHREEQDLRDVMVQGNMTDSIQLVNSVLYDHTGWNKQIDILY